MENSLLSVNILLFLTLQAIQNVRDSKWVSALGIYLQL